MHLAGYGPVAEHGNGAPLELSPRLCDRGPAHDSSEEVRCLFDRPHLVEAERWSFAQEVIPGKKVQRISDRGRCGAAEPSLDVVDAVSSVEQRKQRREEPLGSAPLED